MRWFCELSFVLVFAQNVFLIDSITEYTAHISHTQLREKCKHWRSVHCSSTFSKEYSMSKWMEQIRNSEKSTHTHRIQTKKTNQMPHLRHYNTFHILIRLSDCEIMVIKMYVTNSSEPHFSAVFLRLISKLMAKTKSLIWHFRLGNSDAKPCHRRFALYF